MKQQREAKTTERKKEPAAGEQASATVEALQRYAADLQYPCASMGCRALAGQPCVAVPAGKVHQSRRVLRLITEDGRIAPP